MSNIDPTVPPYGAALTQSVRDNFSAAATELDDHEARIATLEANVAAAAAAAMVSPPDPTGTTSTAYRMMGLGGTLAPSQPGRALVTVSGQIQNSSTNQQTSVVICVGTGAPPVNGALQTATNGVIIGTPARFEATSNGAPFAPFSLTVLLPNIVAGTAYWIDLALRVTGGTGNVMDLTLTMTELL